MTAVPLQQALAAVDIAYTDPPEACRLGTAARAAAAGDPEPVAVAERALGMARTALGELTVAEPNLRRAIEVATAAGLPARAAEARGSLAYLLSLTGRSAQALGELEQAMPALSELPAARLQMLRALVLSELGRFEEAGRGYGEALAVLARAGGDPLLEADIRNNRSMVHVHRRDWPAAQDDLDRAEELYHANGHPGRTAMVYHNRGLAAARRGDLPAALAAYDQAAALYQASGLDPGLLPIERAEALLSVLLLGEARQAAEAAVVQFGRQRNAVDLVQARLLLARTALLAGDLSVAAGEAERARRSATRQERPGWAALARYLALRARWESGRRGEAMMHTGRRVAAALTGAGWVVEALDARLLAARAALELGRPAAARRELAEAARAHQDGPAELRARSWHAQALLRLADGDRSGAQAAVHAGLLVLERFQASLGATELRVHAAGHASELAQLGVRLAMQAGDAESVLSWAERWRAGALMLRPVRPADDAELALDLAELRQVTAELGAPGADVEGLLKRQAALEESVRQRCRRAGGGRRTDLGPLRSVPDLHRACGRSVLVEYLAVDGELHAVVLAGGQVRLHRLGPVAAVEHDLAALRYGLRRLAYRYGSAPSLAAAAELVRDKAGRLDGALLRPLLGDADGRPLVIVPTGALHALPWAALPSCTGRPLSVAPSAALWHRAASAGAVEPGRRLFASGPGLPHAAAEVIALARQYPGARRRTGRNATVEAVTRALDGAELAHIAAHGHFRADNPLFSALQLIDGPLTVYDLERLDRPPRHMVLSACESGLPAVHPGDELIGLAAALLALGSTSLIATVVPVPDDASRPLMLQLHRHLRAGASPAVALALAQQKLTGADITARVAATGFLCYGAG